MKYLPKLTLQTALMLFACASGYAQHFRDQAQNPRQLGLTGASVSAASQPRLDQTARAPGKRTITGTVEEFRYHVEPVGQIGDQHAHSIIRLQMRDGRNHVLDVGERENLDRLQLQTGDTIRVTGGFDMVSGGQVFVAETVRVNGRAIPLKRHPAHRQNAGVEQTIAGTIQGFRHVNVARSRGQTETHTLVRLKLNDGRLRVVDLGRRIDLQPLGLRKGEALLINGYRGRRAGLDAFVADEITLLDRRQQELENSPGRRDSRQRPNGEEGA